MSHVETSSPAESFAGTFCLVTGAALGLLVLAVRLEGLWQFPTGLIRRNPVLMCGLSVGLILSGSRLLWRSRIVSTAWTPTQSGRRFHTAVLYSKENCSLCEEAATVLSAYRRFLPPIKTIDVTGHSELRDKYASCVPVLELDGRKRFVGQINEVLLRRLIEGTLPNRG